MNPDAQAWLDLEARSQPIPLDLSRGHELRLAEWKAVDGGVVVMAFQAFCVCNWSQRFPSYQRDIAEAAYAEHVTECPSDTPAPPAAR